MQKFSRLVGLSSRTLRYYEKIGLLKNIHSNNSGHREYSAKDLEWISFVKRLKETAMPLADIQEYARLRELGSESALQRQAILEQHKENLLAHIEEQQKHVAALDDKILLYKSGKFG